MDKRKADPCANFPDDSTLMQAMCAGGMKRETAFKCLFRKHIGILLKFLLDQSYFKKLNREERTNEAFDVMATVFISVSTAVCKAGHELKGPFHTYFIAALKFEVWRRGKEHSKIKKPEQENDVPAGATEEPEFNTVRIWAAIEKLGEPCRAILTLTAEGYNSEEIALKMGDSDASVRKKGSNAANY